MRSPKSSERLALSAVEGLLVAERECARIPTDHRSLFTVHPALLSLLLAAGMLTGTAQAWTPGSLSPAFWLDASDASTISLSGSKVTEWRDKSSNTHHFSQTSDANRPTLETSVQNGNSAVKFTNSYSSGPYQYVNNTSFQYAGNVMHMFSVHRNSSGGGAIYGRLFSFANSTSEDHDNPDGIILTYGIAGAISLYRNGTIASTPAINDQRFRK